MASKRAILIGELTKLSTYESTGKWEIGVCGRIHDRTCISIVHTFKDHYPKWDNYSGDKTYPVAARINAENAYDTFACWGKSAYGDRRREFCLFLISILRANPRMKIKMYGDL